MVTTTQEGRKPLKGRVILHVNVDPGVRRGLNMLAAIDGVKVDDVLRVLVREDLTRKGLPLPAGISD